MSKKNKKNQQPPNFGGLFIQKRTDKIGRSYYIDREGQRRKQTEYAVQWSKTGRVSKETFEKTIKQLEKFEITDQTEARLIADDFETLRRARPLRKKEIELMEDETTGTQLFFQATDIIRIADEGGAKVKILTPTGDKFRTMKGPKAMETAHQFIDSINNAVKEIQAGDKSLDSPLLKFNFQHNIEENTFYLDFRNIIGIDDFELLNQLIRDNFEAEN
jgi:hypothetical protein